MTDYLLWKNDITNRFSPTTLTDAKTNDSYIATAIISGVTTNSSRRMSQWDAYKDLRERLLIGDNPLPHSTTTQRDLLTGIAISTIIDNITVGRLEKWNSTDWINVSRRSVITNITANIAQAQGSGLLSADLNIISTVTNVNDNVTLPTAIEGITIIIVNNGAKKMNIFPNTDDNIGEGSNTAYSLAAGSTVIFHCFDEINWVSR